VFTLVDSWKVAADYAPSHCASILTALPSVHRTAQLQIPPEAVEVSTERESVNADHASAQVVAEMVLHALCRPKHGRSSCSVEHQQHGSSSAAGTGTFLEPLLLQFSPEESLQEVLKHPATHLPCTMPLVEGGAFQSMWDLHTQKSWRLCSCFSCEQLLAKSGPGFGSALRKSVSAAAAAAAAAGGCGSKRAGVPQGEGPAEQQQGKKRSRRKKNV